MSFMRLGLLALGMSVIVGCRGDDPATAIRETIAAAERAAESRDLGFYRDFIGAGYRDTHGNDREELLRLLRGLFITHSNVEIVNRIDDVTLQGADAARVTLSAGLVGQRAGESLLGGVEGDLYRFELELVNDGGDWRVIGASWDRVVGQ
jgi:hypothetical protein